MAFSKQHFEFVAEHIKAMVDDSISAGNTDRVECLAELARRMANSFDRENPRFRRYQFLVACGVES